MGLIAALSLGSMDSAKAQSSGSENNDFGFRFNVGGGAKYGNTAGINEYATASPQFNISGGENAVWLGPYFTKNFGNENSETTNKGPFSETELMNRYSGTERTVDSSKTITNSFEKPYGFGLKTNIELGKKGLSELELRAGLTQKNTSEDMSAEKTITYSRGDEIMDENTISYNNSTSDSKLVPSFGIGYEQFFGDSKTISLEGFAGYSEGIHGGLGINFYLGGSKK